MLVVVTCRPSFNLKSSFNLSGNWQKVTESGRKWRKAREARLFRPLADLPDSCSNLTLHPRFHADRGESLGLLAEKIF